MTTLEATWERHAAAVVAGDAATVAGDFTPAGMAKALVSGGKGPTALPVAFDIRAAGESQADITYFGEVNRTMRTTWQETQPGQWQIIDLVELGN